MTQFTDFEVWIGSPTPPPVHGTPGVFPVQVFSSPAGPATGELILDITARDFQDELIQAQSVDPNLQVRKAFGGRLFEALFTGKVRDKWMKSRGRIEAGEADGLRLRLWINAPELAVLPWELLWDEQNNNFLATSADLVVSRYLPVPEPPTLFIQGPLRILVVVESPPGVPAIDPEEVEHHTKALQSLGDAVVIEIRRNQTMAEIEDALEQNYHVLHFLGHGMAGKLVVTGDNSQATSVDDEAFAQVVLGRRSLRLVVLNACHSSQADQTGLFTGIGPALIQKGLPAVVAMQYPFVQIDTASRFSQMFYRALANGLPVDEAVNAARRALSAGLLLDSRDWSTPILYMGTRSGHILDFLNKEANAVERAWQVVQAATQGSDEKAALAELAQSFREMVSRHQQLQNLMTLDRRLQDVQTAFEQCTEVVERAGGILYNLQVDELKRNWQRMQQNQVAPLQAFIESHSGVEVKAWFPQLEKQSDHIDNDLKNMALGPLVNHITTYDDQLAQAKALVQQQLDQSLTDLAAFSNQTLGHLHMS